MATANDIKMRITAQDKTGGAFNSAKKGLTGLSKSAAMVKKSILGITAAVAGVGVATKTFAQAADDLAKFSKKTGISTTALQELQYAATQSGIKVETFNMGMQRFTRRAAEAARGTGEAKDALRTLGVQLTDSNGNLLSSEQLLRQVADGFTQIEDPAERVRLAFKLFDSEGVSMIQMLKDGSSAMDDLRRKAQDLGIVLDEETIKRSEEITDNFDTLTRVVKANLTRALVELAPVVASITKGIADFASEIRGLINSTKQIDQLNTLAEIQERLNFLKDREANIVARLNSARGDEKADIRDLALLTKLEEERQKVLKKQLEIRNKLGGEEVKPKPKPQAFKELTEWEEYALGVKNGVKAYNDSIKSITDETSNAVKRGFQGMEDALVEFAMTGKLNFKDLANSIIADLVRIQIRQSMLSMFGGSKGGGLSFGTFFEGVGELFSFAGGGFTGTGSRAGGVDGRGGFPAILHPNETVIDHTQGGAMAAQPVQITYNIQSWDSRDTLMAIQQSAPQIVGIVNEAFNKRGRRGIV